MRLDPPAATVSIGNRAYGDFPACYVRYSPNNLHIVRIDDVARGQTTPKTQFSIPFPAHLAPQMPQPKDPRPAASESCIRPRSAYLDEFGGWAAASVGHPYRHAIAELSFTTGWSDRSFRIYITGRLGRPAIFDVKSLEGTGFSIHLYLSPADICTIFGVD
jgi:hypothetical protein